MRAGKLPAGSNWNGQRRCPREAKEARLFFRLSDWELGLDHLRGRLRGHAVRSPPRPLSPQAFRDAARAFRRPPGCPARARRSDPRVRAHARGRALRSAPCSGRRRRQCDRHDVSARADALRAGSQPLTCACSRAIPTRAFCLSQTIPGIARSAARRPRSKAASSARCGDWPARRSTRLRSRPGRVCTSTV